jgi:hypothetical protein
MAKQQSFMGRLLPRQQPGYPQRSLWARLASGMPPGRMEMLGLALTVLGTVHLLAVAFVPGGVNRVFGLKARYVFGYQTYFAVPDTLGFPPVMEQDGFLLYKIYSQNGEMLDGSFPDPQVRPSLRYDRWAAAGNQATANLPDLHASLMAYLVNQLPEPPLRIEMYAARWVWDRNRFQFPWRGFNRETSLDLRLLGTYNGLTRVWTPAKGGS